MDLAAIGRMFNRLTERHAERMADARPGVLSEVTTRPPPRVGRGQVVTCGPQTFLRPVTPAAATTSPAATATCQTWRHQSTPRVLGSKNRV